MSSNLQITGYEEPTPSQEHADLTQEVKNRQRPLLEFVTTPCRQKEPVVAILSTQK